MTSQFDLVTIDTPRPDELAAFWAAALSLQEVEREDGDRWVVLADEAGVRRLGFQRGVHRPGGTHLDVRCSLADLDGEVARLSELGARLVMPQRAEPWGRIANLEDPDGNPFDVCSYY